MTRNERELGRWKADGQPLVIEHSRGVLETLRKEAIEGLHKIPRGGLEIGGVLFGERSGDRVRILASRRLACEYAAGPNFVLSDRDESALEQLAGSAETDQALAGMIPVGWYHSHTRAGISLTGEDVGLWDRHFSKPWQVALVLRPQKLKPTRAGYFIREGNGKLRTDSSYLEFELEPKPLQRTIPQVAPVLQKQADTVADLELAVVPETVRRPGRMPWLLFALAWCIAVVSLAFAFRDYWMPQSAEPAGQLPALDPVRQQMAIEIQKLQSDLAVQTQRSQALEAEISALNNKPARNQTRK